MHAQSAFSSGGVKRNNHVDKKFHIVIYGSPKCSLIHELRHQSCLQDYQIYMSRHRWIRDCSKIDKHSEHRTRPLIVKFACSCDVTTVLSNRHKLSKTDCPSVSLKPFMPISDRKTESIPLKEKRTLIESGLERKLIQIHYTLTKPKQTLLMKTSLLDINKQSVDPTLPSMLWRQQCYVYERC